MIGAFKSLEDVTVDLGPVNVFIGANGRGKSNLPEAPGALGAAADGAASISRAVPSFRHFDRAARAEKSFRHGALDPAPRAKDFSTPRFFEPLRSK